MKLCILGGGLTGLSLAKSLVKKGLSIDIFLLPTFIRSFPLFGNILLLGLRTVLVINPFGKIGIQIFSTLSKNSSISAFVLCLYILSLIVFFKRSQYKGLTFFVSSENKIYYLSEEGDKVYC